MTSAQIIIVVTIVLYLVAMVFVGVYFGKKGSSSSDDFYLGGRKMGPVVTAMSAEASDMSSYLLMGLPGLAYLCGLPEVTWTAIGLAIGTYLNWLIVARRLRRYSAKLGAITIPDFFARRFGDKKHLLSCIAAVVILIFFIPYTASGFKAIGTLFNSLFGVEYHTAMIVGGIVVVLYTVMGGFMAVSFTDLIQSIFMTIALIVIVCFGVQQAGGLDTVIDNARALPGYLNMTQGYDAASGTAASFSTLSIISTLAWGSQGVLVQTRRHARICALMGIRYFVFAVNKMDLIEYDEKRFRDIENQIAALIEELKLANVTIIPVSATEGDNVTTKSDNMPWYKGEALLSHLETVDIKEDTEKGFYMPVQRVCRPNHEFRGFQGQIENGAIRAGDLVTTLPSKEEAHVKSILVGDKEVQEAVQGQPVTIQLDREVDVSRGCVLTIDSGAVLTDSVEADILWMDDNALTDGKNFFVKIGTKMIPGLVTKINYSVDVNTGEKKSAYTLKKNEIASCTLEFSEKIVVDEFDRHRTLGELILIDRVTNMTSACGVVRKTFVSQDRSQIGKVDEQVRAGLKGQTPVVVEFPIGKEGITLDFAEQVEKGLTVLGKHTYLYHPAASENYAETVRHLKAAGLIVLLVLDENTAKDETLKTLDGFYANWQIDGITVKDAIDFVKKKSAFTVQSVHDGNYI